MQDQDILKLIKRTKSGDGLAFEELSRIYAPLINASAVRFAASLPKGSDMTAEEDLRQDAHLALYRAALKYDSERYDVKFGLFAKICIRNALTSSIRKSKTTVKRLNKVKADIDYGDGRIGAVPTETYNGASFRLSAVEELLSRYEITVFKYYASGMKPGEIAKAVGRDVKSINNAVYRIKSKLREALSRDD